MIEGMSGEMRDGPRIFTAAWRKSRPISGLVPSPSATSTEFTSDTRR